MLQRVKRLMRQLLMYLMKAKAKLLKKWATKSHKHQKNGVEDLLKKKVAEAEVHPNPNTLLRQAKPNRQRKRPI